MPLSMECVLHFVSALLEALDVFGEFNPAEFGLGSDEDEDNDERDEVRLQYTCGKYMSCTHTHLCMYVHVHVIM